MATTDKYDRQLRLWGSHGQHLLSTARICLLGCGPTGTETLKNLVLPGCGFVTLVDGRLVTKETMCNNFFVSEDYMGQPLAKAALELLLEMNGDVKGSYEHASPLDLIASNPDFFLGFTLVIACQLPEESLCSLASRLRPAGIPLLCLRSYGLLGSLRVQVGEHTVTETKANGFQALSLANPFPALRAMVDGLGPTPLAPSVLSSTPPLLLLIKALDAWRAAGGAGSAASASGSGSGSGSGASSISPLRIPKFGKEDGEVKAALAALAPPGPSGDELRSTGTLVEAHKLIKRTRMEGIPQWSAGVLDDPAAAASAAATAAAAAAASGSSSSSTSGSPTTLTQQNILGHHFWVVAAALREFAAAHGGRLPLSGTVEDMEASSAAFTALEEVYRRQSAADVEWVVEWVGRKVGSSSSSASSTTSGSGGGGTSTTPPPPPTDFIARMAKNAREIAALRWGTMEEELCGKGMVEAWQEGLTNAQEMLGGGGGGGGGGGEGGGGGVPIDEEDVEVTAEEKRSPLSPALWYLLLRAADRFWAAKGRWPGEVVGARGSSGSSGSGSGSASASNGSGGGGGVEGPLLESDAKELWEGVVALGGELGLTLPTSSTTFSHRHAEEMVRYGGGEIHSMAAFMGGAGAQEAIKLITHQYVPARLMVWCGIGGFGWPGANPPVLGGF